MKTSFTARAAASAELCPSFVQHGIPQEPGLVFGKSVRTPLVLANVRREFRNHEIRRAR